MFNLLDVNNDGTLGLAEFIEGVKQNKTMMPEDIEKYFHAIDIDHQGTIDFDEFLLAA